MNLVLESATLNRITLDLILILDFLDTILYFTFTTIDTMINERIEELAEQAGVEMCRCGCDAKFAELIIRECQSRIELYIRECGEIGCLPEYVLNRHFGVKQ